MSIIKNKRILYSVLVIAIISLLFCIIPAFGRYKNGVSLSDVHVWNGEAASSYRSGTGTKNNPYIISSAEEFAYFAEMLNSTTYSGKYFKIINDITINKGFFIYEDDTIKYSVDNQIYYVNNDKYYADNDFTSNEIGTLNMFPSLNNFEGNLDCGFNTIYGFYSDEPLFDNIGGTITSLYLNNVLVKGKAILSNSIGSSNISNIYIEGNLISDNQNSDLDFIDSLDNYLSTNEGISGVISTYAVNSNISNVINRANIHGGKLTGSIIGYGENVAINNVYSYGDSYSIVSNLIAVIKGNSSLNNAYNSGEINGGLVGYIINAELNIDNCFLLTDNNITLSITDSLINQENVYRVFDTDNGLVESLKVQDSFLKDKSNLNSFHEFISLDDHSDGNNVWVFNENCYPLLYFDNQINSNVELYVNYDLYNTYSLITNNRYYSSDVSFYISDMSGLNQNEKFYYISNNTEIMKPYDLENVTWIPYDQPVTISQEGSYVIYAKVVDLSNNINFINSNIINIDKINPQIEIVFDDDIYNDINNTSKFINSSKSVNISATDNGGVSTIQYYISNEIVSDLDSLAWEDYSSVINIVENGNYIVYAKATDNAGNVSYASTPYIIYDGYVISDLKPVGFESGNVITKNSMIGMSIKYNSSNQQDFSHYLVTNICLPNNTRIILTDKVNNNTYSYYVKENDAVILNDKYYYNLNLFNVIGKRNKNSYNLTRGAYESYDLLIDFSLSTIDKSVNNLFVNLIGLDDNMNVVRPYVNEEKFSISATDSYTHTLNINSSIPISYNTDSVTNVTVSSIISNSDVVNTYLNNKITGVLINIIDEDGNVIPRDNYKSITFTAFDKVFIPDGEGNIKINLNSNSSEEFILKMSTYKSLNSLPDGDYRIAITPYISYDGEAVLDMNRNSTKYIPLVNSTQEKVYTYSFDVINKSDILFTKPETYTLSYDVIVDGLSKANVKYSLYKKNTLSAYNQDYTLVDIGDYTSSDLDQYISKVYFLTRKAKQYGNNHIVNNFEINLHTENMYKGSYKLVFDLYENDEYINSISKYFIVR